MRPADMWLFAEYMRCAKCGEPCETRTAVAVTTAGQWDGFAHEDCEQP